MEDVTLVSGRRTTGRTKLKWGDVTRKYTKSKEFKDRKHKTGELGGNEGSMRQPKNRANAEEQIR